MAVAIGLGIGVGSLGVGLDTGTGVAVGIGVGILSRGGISSRVRYIAKSRRFGSDGGSVKVRISWLPARITGRVK